MTLRAPQSPQRYSTPLRMAGSPDDVDIMDDACAEAASAGEDIVVVNMQQKKWESGS